jgi:O-antigen ligase
VGRLSGFLKAQNKLTLSFYLILLALPFQRIPSVSIGGLDIRASQIFLLTGLFFLFKNLTRTRIPFEFLFFGLFFLFMVLPGIFAQEIGRAFVYSGITGFTFAIIWLAANTRPDFEKVWYFLKVGGFLLGGFAVFQFIGGFLGLPQFLTLLRDAYVKDVLGVPRSHGFLAEPLYFANYLVFINFISLAIIFNNKGGKSDIHLFFLSGLGILLSISRGAIASYGIILSIFLLFNLGKIKKYIIFLLPALSAFFLFIAIMAIFTPEMIESAYCLLTEIFVGGSAEQRNLFLTFAHQLYIENPIFGIGTANYGPFFFERFKLEGTEGQIVNNQYVEILVENGILGLTFFLIFLTVIVFSFVKVIINQNIPTLEKSITIGIFLGFLVTLIQWMTYSTLYTLWIWAFVSIMVSIRVNNTSFITESPVIKKKHQP